MTEKEKMLSGILYDPGYASGLEKERIFTHDLCFRLNQISPSKIDERKEIIKLLFGKVKEPITINPGFYCDYGYNIEIGKNFFANFNVIILDAAKVKFGDNVFIAPNCGFYTAGHPLDLEQRSFGLEYAYPITIGNNVWIGGNVAVMPGVTIGDNTVIGAGSIVTKNIPSDVLAFGNPCRVYRKITAEDKEKYKK